MKKKFHLIILLGIALAMLGAASAQAGGTNKVKVCHVPPGNPTNWHTITIGENALPAHLAHGDLAGTCEENCEVLCSDGNPCTQDVDPQAAECTCLDTRPPVNCDDSNLCTTDSCDPESGCVYTPVLCDDGDNCTVDACDPLTGFCVAPPVDCPEGQLCDPDTGECTESDPCEPNPCVNGGECSNVGGMAVCSCLPGWTGPHCEFDIDECAANPCVHGECVDLVNAYLCICEPGWTGTDCDIGPTYNCTDRNPCTPENINNGDFYFAADDPNQFIQCDAFGGCFVMSCPPGLVWDQDLLTCSFP